MDVPKIVTLRIRREQRGEGWSEYEVPFEEHTTIVDLLEKIRSTLDATLLYRHSCHHGSCGTCGMIINGEQRLACTTNVSDLIEETPGAVELEPLQTMTHLGDLAVDPTPLFRNFPDDAGYLRPSEINREAVTPEEIDHYVRFENCIECGLCVSACPVVQSRIFTGPAALAAYNREIDKRPERSEELLPQINSDTGVWACDRHLTCSAVCPTGVYPAKHIAVLQRKIKKRAGR